jgi:CRP/FNR family transcriptional regulator
MAYAVCRRPGAVAPGIALHMPCTACQDSGLCMPGLSQAPCREARPGVTIVRRRLAADQVLYAQGDVFEHIYAVRSGTLKSTVTQADGRAQICAFHTVGEVIAMDAMADGVHATSTTALEETQVCAINYAPFAELVGQEAKLRDRLSELMSLEIVRGQRQMMLLGLASARERVASFVMDMSRRFQAQGYSARDFNLRMTRAEIGSYLGLTLETVSRTFALFREEGSLQVDNRRVRIADIQIFSRNCGSLPAIRQA